MTETAGTNSPSKLPGDTPEHSNLTVQLLVAGDGNRRLLASFLDGWANTVSHGTVRDANLYIVDEASLARYRETLLARKRDQHPVFCPVVLLNRADAPPTGGTVDPTPGETPVLVDECLPLPVEKQVLARRLQNLLVRRKQTLDLQRKTERLERFASRLSHELRNPLNILDGYLPIGRDQGDPEAFDKCRAAIDRMDRMISDTLRLARDDESELDVAPVSVPSVVEACWDAVASPQARLDVATGQRIRADEDRLYALLVNLLRNAIEHGGRDVSIRVGALETGFFVEDDGVGIPASERRTVFREGHTTRPDGFGFGLSVVGEVVDAHGWDVRVTDGPAGGSRFEITGVDLAR